MRCCPQLARDSKVICIKNVGFGVGELRTDKGESQYKSKND